MGAVWLAVVLLFALLSGVARADAPEPQQAGERAPDPPGVGPAPPAGPPQEGGEPDPPAPPHEGGGAGPPPDPPPGGAGPPPDEGGAAPPQEGEEPPQPGKGAPTQEEERGDPSQEGGDAPARAPEAPPAELGFPSQEGGDEPSAPVVAPGTPPAQPADVPQPPSEPLVDELMPAMPTAIFAPFTLYVNQVLKGEMVLALKDGDVFVLRSDLEEAGLKVRGGKDADVEGQRLVSLKSLSPPIMYELDERDIVLRIEAPIDFLPTTTIDLAGAPPNVKYQNNTSMFYNYSFRLTDMKQVDVYQELGVATHGGLLYTSSYLSSDFGPRRGLTNYTVNERPTLRRLVLGDTVINTGPLGSAPVLGGVSMSRTYDLDPYAVKTPRIGFVGTTLTPATVDVYVNGVRIRSEDIAPGTFELNNLRVSGGSGEAVYVIRDAFGQEQRISMPFYLASSVLRKGLDEYTYAMGLIRERTMTESWGYTTPVMLGRHRYGLNDALTIAGRVEIGERFVSGGPAITTLTPVGQIECELAASAETGAGAGFASFLSYSYSSRQFGIGTFGNFATERYATAQAAAGLDRPVVEVGLYSSVPVKSVATLSATGRYARYRDQGDGYLMSFQGAMVLRPQLMGMLSAGGSRTADGTGAWDVMLGVNYVFGQRHNAMAATRMSNGDASAQFMVNKSVPLGTGYGYRGSVSVGEVMSGDALAMYQALFGRYSASYARFQDQQSTSFEVAGALALVPGVGLFPTLPVQDSFGIIRLPGVKNVRGYVNNQEIGRTDRQGNLLVPSLLSYYGNRLSIAAADVPLAYSVQLTDLTIAPSQRGVAIAEFPMSMPHFYRGVAVVDEHGKRIVPTYGQIRVAQGDDFLTSPLGELGEFELDGVESGTHRAFVDYVDGSCEFEFVAPSATETVIELGELTCVRP